MNDCRRFRTRLELYALAPETDPQSKQIAAHVNSCSDCQSEVDAMRDAWAALPMALTPVEPSSLLRAKVLDAAGADGGARDPNSGAVRPLSGVFQVSVLKYVLAATVLACLVSGYVSWWQPASVQQTVDREPVGANGLPNMAEFAPLDFASPDVHYVALMRVNSPAPVATYVLCDLVSGQLHFVLFDLDDFEPGGAYRIWLLGPENQVFSSSVLEVSLHQIGKALMDLPPAWFDDIQVAVTHEPGIGVQTLPAEFLLTGTIDGKEWNETAD